MTVSIGRGDPEKHQTLGTGTHACLKLYLRFIRRMALDLDLDEDEYNRNGRGHPHTPHAHAFWSNILNTPHHTVASTWSSKSPAFESILMLSSLDSFMTTTISNDPFIKNEFSCCS